MKPGEAAEDPIQARVDSIVEHCTFAVKKTKLFSTALNQAFSIVLLLILAFLKVPPVPGMRIFETASLFESERVATVATAEDTRAWFIDVTRKLYMLRLNNGSSWITTEPPFQSTFGDIYGSNANLSLPGAAVDGSIHGIIPFGMLSFTLFPPAEFGTLETFRTAGGCQLPNQLSVLSSSVTQVIATDLCRNYDTQNRTLSFLFGFQSERDIKAAFAELDRLEKIPINVDSNIDVVFPLYIRSVDVLLVVEAHFDTLQSDVTFLNTAISPVRLDSASGVIQLIVLSLFGLSTVLHGYYLLRTLFLFRRLEGDWSAVVSFKTLYDLTAIGISAFCIGCFIRFTIMSQDLFNGSFRQSSEKELFRFATDFAPRRRTLELSIGWALMLNILRSLFYMHYLSRLATVSETILSCIPAITGCAIVLLLNMVTFTVAGQIIFGHAERDFYSFQSAATFLCLLIFREGSLDYTPYFQEAPISSVVYFLLFAMISQIVVLNIVVGIVASAFSAVISSMELVRTPQWTLAAIGRDFRAIVHRFRDRILVRGTSSREQTLATLFINERVTIANALRDQLLQGRLRTDSLLTSIELKKVAPSVALSTLEGIVQKAAFHIGTSDAVLRQLRTTVQRMTKTEKMEKQLKEQILIVDELYQALIGTSSTPGAPAVAPSPAGVGTPLANGAGKRTSSEREKLTAQVTAIYEAMIELEEDYRQLDLASKGLSQQLDSLL